MMKWPFQNHFLYPIAYFFYFYDIFPHSRNYMAVSFSLKSYTFHLDKIPHTSYLISPLINKLILND